jgi:hypothetical protein
MERPSSSAVLGLNKEFAMLRVGLFCIAATLAATTAPAALNDQGPVGGKPYDDQLDAANEMFLGDLRKRLQQKGFEEVSIVPQMFVVRAKDKGRHITLIVDSDSLQAMAIGPGHHQLCPAPADETR